MTLRLTHVTKSFGATTAVDDVSVEIEPGEIVGLIGENGAGKTTLMRILAGEIAADRGSIDAGGTVGFVHQHFMLVNEFTVAENLALVDVHMPGDNRLVRDLSVGEKARVELTKAIAKRPDVLILDEPTSVLTPSEAEELFATARTLAADGKIVILISHKIREVLSVATRTIVMRRGRVVADGRGMNAEELARAMVDVVPLARLRSAQPTSPQEEVIAAPPVRAGEIVAIIGVAGNGQTEIAAKLRDTLPRATTAHIPEDRTRDGVIAEMTIADNLALVTDKAADELIAAFNIRASGPRQLAGKLSGGNQQKLVLAREFARDPDVIVAAEPTRGLDIESTRFVHDQLRAAAARGAAILLITSDLDEAFSLADAIHVIYRGNLSARLTAAEAAERAGALMAGVP